MVRENAIKVASQKTNFTFQAICKKSRIQSISNVSRKSNFPSDFETSKFGNYLSFPKFMLYISLFLSFGYKFVSKFVEMKLVKTCKIDTHSESSSKIFWKITQTSNAIWHFKNEKLKHANFWGALPCKVKALQNFACLNFRFWSLTQH